jgi:ribosomal protein L11
VTDKQFSERPMPPHPSSPLVAWLPLLGPAVTPRGAQLTEICFSFNKETKQRMGVREALEMPVAENCSQPSMLVPKSEQLLKGGAWLTRTQLC